MKTVPLSGSLQTVTFFEDDTLETVRQLVALAVGSHPDRLFLEVQARLPKDYYANPLHWSTLFYRLSFDGQRIVSEMLKIYTTQTRPGTVFDPRDLTKEEWDARGPDLAPLYASETEFDEWRALGVEETQSFCMPLPPRDLPSLQAASRPTLHPQSLFESLHPYEITEIRATEVQTESSPNVRLNYFPRLRPDTPTTVEPLRSAIEASQVQLRALLNLDVPKREEVSIVRAKWYIPLVSTEITAPRTRFEQMFYGLTVSETTTPYVGFFTSKTETIRHKFYVKDPKAKTPSLDIPVWRGWLSTTLPQRRLPTLLLYRGGSSRTVFDRIAITERDITVDVRRDKTSTATLEELRAEMETWLLSLDAVTPFLAASDLTSDRWQLSTLSALASYRSEVREFDMLRFPCLQGLFSFQSNKFRLLRAEHTSDDVTPQDLQILQMLQQDDGTPETMAADLGLSVAEVNDRIARVGTLSEEINLEKSLRAYPTIEFRPKEVLLSFVSKLDRTLDYVDILRHVLTSDSEQVDAICPKRMERVGAKVVVPQTEVDLEADFAADDDFNALLGFGAESEAAPPTEDPGAAPSKGKKVRVTSRAVGTYNYFNTRLQEFDPATFDKSIYPNKCDKPRQVVVLTPADKERMGSTFDYSKASPDEVLELSDPDGTAICPPYWCVRDQIPLTEEQLVTAPDGTPRCPQCDGKVRSTDDVDLVEYPVIKRDMAAKYPDYLKAEYASTKNGRRIPCCYQSPRAKTATLSPKDESTYVLDATSQSVGPLRFAYLDADLAERLQLPLSYATSIKKGRIGAGEADLFRVGMGRPSETAEKLLGATKKVPRPKDAPRDVLYRCSFFRTWPGRGAGDDELDRITASIDQAYHQGTLGFLEELEYVASSLSVEVIRVDRATGQVLCGFGSDLGGASKTVVLLGSTILAEVSRPKTSGHKPVFQTDLRKKGFPKETLTLLLDRHARACASNYPVLSDAVAELKAKGNADYQVILDPFKRVQAAFVPGQGILPVSPTTTQIDAGVPVRRGYSDLREEELPTVESQTAFVDALKHPLFAIREPVRNVNGLVVELELASGFRVPVRPASEEPSPEPARELTETIRRFDEDTLVAMPANAEDLREAERIAYSSEIFEFLLFSISKSIATDPYDQILDAGYASLRAAIADRSETLLSDLQKWFKKEAYEDTTKTPVTFVNKIRTPCGQYTDKDACSASSLCGWKQIKGKGICKIRVKPVVDTSLLLRRLTKTLRENDKQRALVLDGRMSPFFSTVLYLEMPHELITTTL